MAQMQLSLSSLNQGDKTNFVTSLGGIFEHSAWVAERAFQHKPFASLDDLHQEMVQIVARALVTEQLALIRAHPDLAGKAARAGKLTASSSKEQTGAGLDKLSDEEFERFHKLNNAYKDKFDFPFILAVKGHTKHSILAAFESRLHHTVEAERETALVQIAQIARFRLEDLLSDEQNSRP
jgi:2-oxo-4-hydroxy-4-carboxy-5-ureidoimidazoline decarboxylase